MVKWCVNQFSGEKALRLWLKEHGFPAAPVLAWHHGEVFRELAERKMRIKAVVGGPEVVKSARAYAPVVFSFDRTSGAEAVADWEDVMKGLR